MEVNVIYFFVFFVEILPFHYRHQKLCFRKRIFINYYLQQYSSQTVIVFTQRKLEMLRFSRQPCKWPDNLISFKINMCRSLSMKRNWSFCIYVFCKSHICMNYDLWCYWIHWIKWKTALVWRYFCWRDLHLCFLLDPVDKIKTFLVWGKSVEGYELLNVWVSEDLFGVARIRSLVKHVCNFYVSAQDIVWN